MKAAATTTAEGSRGSARARQRDEDLVEQLADARSRQVVFLSHCLLNENVRFLGGAARPGAVAEAVEPYLRSGVGIVQLPCPEQRAWGGVLKSRMTALYGRPLLRLPPARRLVVGAARVLTMLEYRRLARRVAAQAADYVAAGFEVVEVVGVGASPSCGVTTTLDLDGAVAAMAGCHRCELRPALVRQRVVSHNVVPGSGMFVAALRRCLSTRGIDPVFREHDLLAELGIAPRSSPTASGR